MGEEAVAVSNRVIRVMIDGRPVGLELTESQHDRFLSAMRTQKDGPSAIAEWDAMSPAERTRAQRDSEWFFGKLMTKAKLALP